jgi:hypothetical protein
MRNGGCKKDSNIALSKWKEYFFKKERKRKGKQKEKFN